MDCKHINRKNEVCEDCHICLNCNKMGREANSRLMLKLIGHIRASYKARKGGDYPFMPQDGELVKDMMANISCYQLMALWDLFMETPNKYWNTQKREYVIQPKSINIFRYKLSFLMENPDWKPLMEKYEKEGMGKEDLENKDKLNRLLDGMKSNE